MMSVTEWIWFTWLIVVPTILTLWNLLSVWKIRKEQYLYMLYSSTAAKALIWYAVLFLVQWTWTKSLVIIGYLAWTMVMQNRIRDPDADLKRLEDETFRKHRDH